MSIIPLAEFITMLPRIAHDVKMAERKIIERGAIMIEKRAKANIGREHDDWAPLAASTIADKAKHGFPTPKPLLRTGALRDSISHVIVSDREALIGSDSPIAPIQEFGSSRIPPRSFLLSAALSSAPKIQKLAAAATIGALAGHGKGVRELHELMRMLHHLGHELRELADDLLNDDDAEESKRR